MVQIFSDRSEIVIKLVYYGPGLSGKTTNLLTIHESTDPENSMELFSIKTKEDRTLFFDLLPFNIGSIGKYKIKLQLYTVPGQVQYDATRRAVLAATDGVVFVADSQNHMLQENIFSLQNLSQNLKANNLSIRTIPIVMQYNKRDLPEVMSVEEMGARLNPLNWPSFSSIAVTGWGVFETLISISSLAIDKIIKQFNLGKRGTSTPEIIQMIEEVFGEFIVPPPEDLGDSLASGDDVSTQTQGEILTEKALDEPEELIIPPPDDTTMIRDLYSDSELISKAVESNLEVAQLNAHVNELKTELEKRVRLTSAINSVSRIITSTMDITDIFRTVFSAIGNNLKIQRYSLLIYDQENQRLKEYFNNGFDVDILAGFILSEDEALADYILKRKKRIIIRVSDNNTFEDLDISKDQVKLLHKVLTDKNVIQLISLPLYSPGVFHGLINVYIVRDKKEKLLSEDDINFLDSLALQTAIALENLRLYREIQNHRDNLEDEVRKRSEELIESLNKQNQLSQKLKKRNEELERLTKKLSVSEQKLREYSKALKIKVIKQSEELEEKNVMLEEADKMASIGKLAAGVAHEINNPVGFIASNLSVIEEYSRDLFALLRSYYDFEGVLPSDNKDINKVLAEIHNSRNEKDIDFILDDFSRVINESLDGTDRIKRIVADLKNFSHTDSGELKLANINYGLESTINIVWNEIKYKAELEKHLGKIPEIFCYPQELNQVFMNMLVNASQAIETHGKITVETSLTTRNDSEKGEREYIAVKISDTGGGIPPEIQDKIFDPFFTTKEVGEGTGLGLSVTYGIIKKHMGNIELKSEQGKGTEFTILIPTDLEKLFDEEDDNDET